MALRWNEQDGMDCRERTVFLEATGSYLVPWFQPGPGLSVASKSVFLKIKMKALAGIAQWIEHGL